MSAFARADTIVVTARHVWFTPAELRRVGVATTMIAVTTTVIILGILATTGHYSSLSHCLPKAVLDGAAIAMLMGRRGRWRCVALLGVVYGLVLLLQIGVFYLIAVMSVAGITAALVGRVASIGHRGLGIVVAAVTYELLASFGTPIKLLFATGSSEPLPWLLWLSEWPLRIAGATSGVWLGIRSHRSMLTAGIVVPPTDGAAVVRKPTGQKQSRKFGIHRAGICVFASMVACIAPMMIQNWRVLAAIAVAYVIYAISFGLGIKKIATAALGLIWGWAVLAALSYAWHRDTDRVIDLMRTFGLRFAPLTFASTLLVTTVRPTDIVRLMRRYHVPRIVILPFAHVLRELPGSRRQFVSAFQRLRRDGIWRGPQSVVRHPRIIASALIGPQLRRWASELRES